MRNGQRSVGGRIGRALLIAIGFLGGLAAIDAILFCVFLLILAPVVGAGSLPLTLLALVVLPLIALVGGALAWVAYTVWMDEVPASEPGGHEVKV